MITEGLSTAFSWVFLKRRHHTGSNMEEREERAKINDQDQVFNLERDKNKEGPQVIDIKAETDDMTISEIVSIVIQELGIRQQVDHELSFIQRRLEMMTLKQATKCTWLTFIKEFNDTVIDKNDNTEAYQTQIANFKKEDNKEQGVLQFYSTRKKKSRISDEYKAKLVIDAKMNSLTMTEICRKYFIWYSTARNIIREVTDYKWFPINVEKRRRRGRLVQDRIKKSIDKCLCSS